MTTSLSTGFRELRELGSGASGRVVAAVHEASGRQVAIKYLADWLCARPHFRAAFRDEARLLAAVRSPHVVELLDYLETQDRAAIVMELVDGCTLRDLIRLEGPTGPLAALTVLQGSLRGLAAAHRVGVVHRDFKPGNILITTAGQSKLTDFGVAARSGDQAGVAGTPLYMAPEQWHGRPADPATDVYAATAVFFECLTGHGPYDGDTESELALQHTRAPIPVELAPEPLRPLFRHGLAKNPADRPRSAEEFLAELQEAAHRGYGPDWERRGLAALGAAATGLLSAAAGTAAAGSGAAGTGGTAAAGSSGRTVLKLSLKSVPAKVGAGIAAGALVVTGVLVGVRELHSSPPSRPVAQRSAAAVPAVTIAYRATPQQATAASPYIEAKYPVVTGLRDAAVQQRIDRILQQPLDSWAADVASSAKGQNVSPASARSSVFERTNAVQAGKLLSVTYNWGGPDNLAGGGGKIVVVRLDTGTVVPEKTILTPAAATDEGAGRISAGFDTADKVDQRCIQSYTPQHFAAAVKALGTRDDYELQLGVASKGIVFYPFPGAQDCGYPPVTLPYATLTGLVQPQIIALAANR